MKKNNVFSNADNDDIVVIIFLYAGPNTLLKAAEVVGFLLRTD